MEPLRFSVEPRKGGSTIALVAPSFIDNTELDQLIERLIATIDTLNPPNVVLDLSKVEYIASAMLGLLINLRQRINARQGKLILAQMPRKLEEVIYTTSMHKLFTIVRDLPS
jgi:anti-sigma B factor antagonist